MADSLDNMRQALANADYWGSWGIVYCCTAEENAYWNAYQWSRAAANRFYNAWWNSPY